MPYDSYRAVLSRRSERGPAEIWSADGLTPEYQDQLAFGMPGSLLPPGEYELELAGRMATGPPSARSPLAGPRSESTPPSGDRALSVPGGGLDEGAPALQRDARELIDANLTQVDAERRELVVHAREYVAVERALVLEQRV